jgi:hypothetical protein
MVELKWVEQTLIPPVTAACVSAHTTTGPIFQSARPDTTVCAHQLALLGLGLKVSLQRMKPSLFEFPIYATAWEYKIVK